VFSDAAVAAKSSTARMWTTAMDNRVARNDGNEGSIPFLNPNLL
jgi:hypothetical protein